MGKMCLDCARAYLYSASPRLDRPASLPAKVNQPFTAYFLLHVGDHRKDNVADLQDDFAPFIRRAASKQIDGVVGQHLFRRQLHQGLCKIVLKDWALV